MKNLLIGVLGIMVLITLGCSTTPTAPLTQTPEPSRYETAFKWFASANAHVQSGNYEEAVKDYTQAITSAPNFADAYYNRGRVLGRLGRHGQAIDDFSEAISLNPKDANMFADRGVAYGSLGRHEQAINDFTEAINLNPNFAGAYYNRAIGYLADKNCSEARKDVRKAQELGYPKVRPDFLDNMNKECPEN
jgi:tetratricopeptide (TPR) repeat protein